MLKPKHITLLLALFFTVGISFSQEDTTVKGVVVNAADGNPLENVNIVNINQVRGTATNVKGEFEISAKVNDTLHLSYLGFKSIRVRVTNDWVKFKTATVIELTELAMALEEVVVSQIKLTGVLKVDIEQVPINTNYRYSISGLPTTGYEAGNRAPNAVNKVLGAIFNPADFLYRMFGKQPN
ncbi:MAG: carboxypeptidase-like regulatory domain-containing protein, partial [Mangrovimonas sp.]|nr:carboxypeptidase-like regulatory domain-containing protein [Mangrovimonas sp.]